METVSLWGQSGSHLPLERPADISALRAFLRTAPTSAADRSDASFEAELHIVGNRICARVEGVTLGWIPDNLAPGYRPVLQRLLDQGLRPTVTARWNLYGDALTESDAYYDRDDPLGSNGALALGLPHLITPANQPPSAAHLALPVGHRLKVAVGATAPEGVWRPWVQRHGGAWVHATLHTRTEQLARTTRDIVEVRVDSVLIGTLTPASSKRLVPLIGLIAATGRLTVARGLIQGNSLAVEMVIAVVKAAEVSERWLAANGLTGRAATASVPGVAEAQATASPSVVREPGFYPDPDGVADQRFWDGHEWTSRIRMNPH
ncbi:DUF2510 domain-containing protein [Nocardioides sp.]|uniref:DUF2510 domain-containing protein n=1 Tax=Nocardioides sp. TaxID=35761 RepID=UPI00351276F7